ncbi:MAG TPA: hypothetical protein VMT30_05940 [Candidatus Saccharimonadia bacterium]|nr:hypothetical protein [Candidatus Saccharimonadia bacterium]
MRLPNFTKSAINQAGILYFTLTLGLTALIFVSVQQSLRQSANDPQIQLAEDGAAAMAKGTAPADIVGDQPVDVVASLKPIVITYRGDGGLAAFNGEFGSAKPVPPDGAFAYARAHGQNRFTWEPAPGLRLATVLVYNGGEHPGYVLAARNLREIELREDQTQNYALAVLAALLIVGIFVLVVIK